MHRKQSLDYFHQSFERVPVRSRSTNEFSFADASSKRLDYKAFAERGQCVFAQKNADQLNHKGAIPMKQNNQNQSFAAFIGLDKSDKKINVSLQRCGQSRIERNMIKGGAEALHAWVAELCAQFPHQQIAISLEPARSIAATLGPSFFTRASLSTPTNLSVIASGLAPSTRCKKPPTKAIGVIIRALAYKWIRILFRCWQKRTPYDEIRYLKSLQKSSSPLLPFLAQPATQSCCE
jgi:hypothetical protein